MAFKTKAIYFAVGQGYKIDSSGFRFALVSDQILDCGRDGLGYNMSVLLNPQDTPSNNVMVNSKLKNADMVMRLASVKELQLIKKAIATKKARFEYGFNMDRVIEQLDYAIYLLEDKPASALSL